MTPREIFAAAAYAEKLRGDDKAEALNIAAVAAQSATGNKKAGQALDRLFKDLIDFVPAEG